MTDEASSWLGPWWKKAPKRWGHPWHSMCSYLAMFPPALPRYLIEQCSRPGDLVLDPFSGRGTTPLEACLAGRVGIGSDANPLAAVLTAAKTQFVTVDQARERVDELHLGYRRSAVSTAATPSEIKLLFDGRRTLPQLEYLRRKLSRCSDCDNFLLAVLAGILHGNHPKNPRESKSLSISMPNTFSMAPGYIAKFKRQNKLRKYPFDCFSLLHQRLDHLFREPAPVMRGRSSERDARTIHEWLDPQSVDLVVTSPPYLQVVRYAKYNWIRLWLLGFSVESVNQRLKVEATDNKMGLSDRLSAPKYCDFVRQVVESLGRVVRDGGVAAIVIGDVSSPKGEVNLAWKAWTSIRRNVPFDLIEMIDDEVEVNSKVTRIWGSRKGRATKRDRVIVLRRHGGRRTWPRRPEGVMARLLEAP